MGVAMGEKFVRNTWYAAAWSDEIGRKLFSRRLLNVPVVLYRKEDGAVCALNDRCPHRFAPLSVGKLVGDDVECLYHGLRFDCRGICTDNPNAGGVIPRAARVQSYPVVERWGLVWIWMGDPDRADSSSIPEFPWLVDKDRYTETHGTLKIKSNYLLVLDNLTDLSHASFVHVNTFEPREMARTPFKVSEQNGQIWTRVFIPSMEVPQFFTLVKGLTGRMDHWLEMRCDPPGCMVTFYGVTPPGKTREEGYGTYDPNIITPETDCTTHYFWASSRDFDLADEAMTRASHEGAVYAFENEDIPILEAQQAGLGAVDLMDLKPVLLLNDAASGRARRVIERRLREEAEAAGSCTTTA